MSRGLAIVGVNVFFQTVARAASFFAKYPEYEAWGWEIRAGRRDREVSRFKN